MPASPVDTPAERLGSDLTSLSLDEVPSEEVLQSPVPVTRHRVSLSDFEFGHVLGRGSFSTVAIATKTSTGEIFAMKSLSKRMLIAVRQTNSAMLEREILRRPSHPFIVRMYYAFTSETCLHLVLDYMPGGDLYGRLEAEGRLPVSRVRLHAAGSSALALALA